MNFLIWEHMPRSRDMNNWSWKPSATDVWLGKSSTTIGKPKRKKNKRERNLSERTRELLSLKSNAPRHDASAASLPNAEGSEKIGQPLSAEDRATVEQYLADVTCPVCHCPKHMHRPGCSAESDKGIL